MARLDNIKSVASSASGLRTSRIYVVFRYGLFVLGPVSSFLARVAEHDSKDWRLGPGGCVALIAKVAGPYVLH